MEGKEIICISRDECPYCDDEGVCIHPIIFKNMNEPVKTCDEKWEECPIKRRPDE